MKYLEMLIVVALIAVVFALFAWAAAKIQNASQRDTRRRVIGNANRQFFRRHFRKVYLAPLLFERVAAWFGIIPPPRGRIQFANIGEGTFESGKKSYIPDASSSGRYLIYKIGSDADHVALCGAGDIPIGCSDDQADTTNGQPIAIKLFGVCPGMLRVQTDGTIANGNYVKTGANGQATVANTGDAGQFGKALFGTDASANAGDTITIVHDVPSKVAF